MFFSSVCVCVLHVSGVGDSAKVYGFGGARGIRIGFAGAFRARLGFKRLQHWCNARSKTKNLRSNPYLFSLTPSPKH